MSNEIRARQLLAEGGYPDGWGECSSGYGDSRLDEALELLGYDGISVILNVYPSGITVTRCSSTLLPSPTLMPTPTPVPASWYYEKGEEFSANRDWIQADRQYSSSIDRDSYFVQAYLSRGINTYNARLQGFSFSPDSRQDFSRVIELEPDNAEAHKLRALVGGAEFVDEQNETLNAVASARAIINDYQKSIDLNPYDAVTYWLRGKKCPTIEPHWPRSYGVDFGCPPAIDDYGMAINVDPAFRHAYFDRAIHYHESRQYQKAIDDYTKAIHLEPSWVLAYINRAISYHWVNLQKEKEDKKTACSLESTWCGKVYETPLQSTCDGMDRDFCYLVSKN
jgi:tetratricopeptide (TPR) repeat protein